MKRYLPTIGREAARAAVTVLVVLGVLGFPESRVLEALAGFSASPQAWTAAYELDPTATDPVGQGDDHLRQNKFEVRSRVETEMDFGEIGNVTTDTGRLLEGGARAFFDNTAPTVAGAITDACLAEADYDGNRGCDEGRLWVDADDSNKLYACDDTDADGDCDAWEAVSAMATLTASRAVVTDGSGVLTAATTTATEIGYVNGVTSALQTQLNAKAPLASPTFTGTITTPLTASRAVVTGASSELAASAATATEVGYLSGVTSAIQTQINNISSDFELLAVYSPSSAASVDMTSVISATYAYYRIEFNLLHSDDSEHLYLRSDTSNGASFDAGASDYEFAGLVFTTAASALSGDTSDSEISVCGDLAGGADPGNTGFGEQGYIEWNRVTASAIYHCGYHTSGGVRLTQFGSGRRVTGTPDALQLSPGTGVFTGTVRIYGRRAS